MEKYLNNVVISGRIHQIRSSANGTCFISLLQIVKFNQVEHQRQYELLISPEKFELIPLVELNKCIKVTGELTIFKVKKYSIYKMMINVLNLEILPDDAFPQTEITTANDSTEETF